MAFRNTERLNLLTDLYLKQETISVPYSYIGLSIDQTDNLIDCLANSNHGKRIYSFAFVPDYLKTAISNQKTWTERVFPSVHGYSIRVDEHTNVEQYLRVHLKNRRKSINRALRRLESCFDISYKMFQENITEQQYHFLMGSLKSMIIKRFEQKHQKSESLAIWDKVLSTSFELIKDGKASIFVIYDGEEPIEISFNYNYGTILFSYISSYDIDYAKFSLGQIEIYKQLEWCINNGYTQFDMGWGGMDYKKQWSNDVYSFNHHILYQKYSISGFLYALLWGNRSRILGFLIAKGVNTRIKKIKEKIKGNHTTPNNTPIYKFGEILLSPLEQFEEVSLRQNDLPIAKKVIYDFLFLTQEHSSNVSLYYSKTNDMYILKGRKVVKAILLNHTKN